MAIDLFCIIPEALPVVCQQLGTLVSTDEEGRPQIVIGGQSCRLHVNDWDDDKPMEKGTLFLFRLDKFDLDRSTGTALLGILQICHRLPGGMWVRFENETKVLECAHVPGKGIQVTMTPYWKAAALGVAGDETQ